MTYVPEALRVQVSERAGYRCEYCLLHERYTVKTHEIDHIIAEKHAGETLENNLCLSCIDCNRHKGSDLCSYDAPTNEVISLFHPRHDHWEDHFRVEAGLIRPLSAAGRVTVRLLQLNQPERVAERRRLAALNRYP